MCDEYTDESSDKIIRLTENEYNDLWFALQWDEDKEKIREQEKQLNGLVKWLGI